MTSLPRRVTAASVSVLALVTLTACGSKSGDSAASTPTGSSSVSSPTPSDSSQIVGVTVTGDKSKEPTITVSPGAPKPAGLQIKDLYVGDGAEVKLSDTVTAHYVGVDLATGQIFDSSWKRGQPAQFPLSNVIAGWQQGVPSMKVGGRRLLVIPADLAYGDNPQGGAPAGPLVFVVDVVSVP